MFCCAKKNLESLSVDVNYVYTHRGGIAFNISLHNHQRGGVVLNKCSGRLESITKIRKSSKGQLRIHLEESTNERDLIEKPISFFPNEKKILKLHEIIPSNWPPSFAGKWIQYVSKLRLSFKINDSSTVSLEFIIRNPPCELYIPSSLKQIGQITPVSRCIMRKMNPFLGENITQDESSGFKKPSQSPKDVFRIQENNKEIVRIHNIASNYFPSQKIFGILNFAHAEIHCMKFTVSLMSIEVSNSDSVLMFKDEKKSWCTWSEMVFGLQSTAFEMFVPDNITPTFITDLVNLKWCLQFTFHLSDAQELTQSVGTPEWEAPARVSVMSKTWNHPLKMYSPLMTKRTRE